MPVKSAKQMGAMQMAAHGGGGALGINPEVAKEFIHKTPAAKRKSFAKVLAAKRKKK